MRATLGLGLNPLVQAASPLLLLAAQMRETASSMDVPGCGATRWRRSAASKSRRARPASRARSCSSASYALCAALDEAVLSTPWGAQSEWAQHPLLVALHREAWGGEKFFEMLDRISQDPARYIDLMELQYLGIAFGFAGKYQIQERGQEHLQQVQHDLVSQDPRAARSGVDPSCRSAGAVSRIGAIR